MANIFEFDELLNFPPTLLKLKKMVRNPDLYLAPDDRHPKQHSKDLDRILGYRIPKIEQRLLRKYRPFYKKSDDSNKKKHFEGTQTWIGLHPQVLQTPYSEIMHFLSYLKKFEPKKIVDLGAGYGRIGIVMNSLFPEASFLGFEILDIRLNEARRVFERLEFSNCEMQSQNILDDDFIIPAADAYFIYDFSDPQDLKKILKQLSSKIGTERFFVIAKGEGVRSMIQLKFPEFWAPYGVIHQKEWSLYSSFCDIE
jgi:hypothetical protein